MINPCNQISKGKLLPNSQIEIWRHRSFTKVVVFRFTRISYWEKKKAERPTKLYINRIKECVVKSIAELCVRKWALRCTSYIISMERNCVTIKPKYNKNTLLLWCAFSEGPQSIHKSVIMCRRARFYVQIDAVCDIRPTGENKWNAACTHLAQPCQMVFCYHLLTVRLNSEEKFLTYFLLECNEQNGLQE